jgi:hypothetical protein
LQHTSKDEDNTSYDDCLSAISLNSESQSLTGSPSTERVGDQGSWNGSYESTFQISSNPDCKKGDPPKQERGHNESHIIVVVGFLRCHVYRPEEIGCCDDIGDNTQIITEQGGAHAEFDELGSDQEMEITYAAKQAQRKAYSFGGSIVSVCNCD